MSYGGIKCEMELKTGTFEKLFVFPVPSQSYSAEVIHPDPDCLSCWNLSSLAILNQGAVASCGAFQGCQAILVLLGAQT